MENTFSPYPLSTIDEGCLSNRGFFLDCRLADQRLDPISVDLRVFILLGLCSWLVSGLSDTLNVTDVKERKKTWP